MARQKLNLSPEKRKVYNNEMHKKQTRIRRKRAEREACISIVWEMVHTFESLGWEKTDLVVGADEKMVAAVVDKLMEKDKFKITLGSKIGVRLKKKGEKHD